MRSAEDVVAAALARHRTLFEDTDDMPSEYHGYARAVLRALMIEGYTLVRPVSREEEDADSRWWSEGGR